MKANQIIEVPNWRGFDKGVLLPGQSSSFRVLPGQDLEIVMKEHNLNELEIKELTTRILKGNPHWVTLENKEETQELKKVTIDKEKEKKRKEELGKLKKIQQVDLLKKLGIKEKDIPVYEPDRIELIYSLENHDK